MASQVFIRQLLLLNQFRKSDPSERRLPRMPYHLAAIDVLILQQIRYHQVADVGLGVIGVVVGDGLDVIARNRDRPLGAETLIDVVDADLAKFIRALCAGETKRTHLPVESVKDILAEIREMQFATLG